LTPLKTLNPSQPTQQVNLLLVVEANLQRLEEVVSAQGVFRGAKHAHDASDKNPLKPERERDIGLENLLAAGSRVWPGGQSKWWGGA
jgi:hypothetical protein